MTDINELVDTVRHRVSSVPHIVVDQSKCLDCDARPCLLVCPAQCFTAEADGVHFGYEGCLECGTCRVVCPAGAITWSYPPGGFGVTFRVG
jgi:ferredoxin like protein